MPAPRRHPPWRMLDQRAAHSRYSPCGDFHSVISQCEHAGHSVVGSETVAYWHIDIKHAVPHRPRRLMAFAGSPANIPYTKKSNSVYTTRRLRQRSSPLRIATGTSHATSATAHPHRVPCSNAVRPERRIRPATVCPHAANALTGATRARHIVRPSCRRPASPRLTAQSRPVRTPGASLHSENTPQPGGDPHAQDTTGQERRTAGDHGR